jgi:gamma-glutamyltranspeptidase/glutathione hydrolase
MAMRERLETLRKYPESASYFLKTMNHMNLEIYSNNPQLANTLEILSQRGEKAFYEGEIGQKIINSIQNVGGVMSIDDLKNYKLVKRKALRAKFKEYEIISMPPPSSGGLVIIQILKLLENLDYKTIRERDYLHYLTSANAVGIL